MIMQTPKQVRKVNLGKSRFIVEGQHSGMPVLPAKRSGCSHAMHERREYRGRY